MGKKAKTKIPKRFAGVRVPKSVRKSKMLKEALSTSVGRAIVADAVVAGATAAAAALARNRPSTEQVAHAGEAVVDTGAKVSSVAGTAVHALADILTSAAERILPSIRGEGSRKKAKRRQATDQRFAPGGFAREALPVEARPGRTEPGPGPEGEPAAQR